MAYKAKYYDKKTLTERVWHNSSMIKYTEMTEDPDENFGELTVVFNNGATYKYKDVALSDYVLMVGGGLDASNGKTFNKVIKERGYAYERVEPLSQEYIDQGFEEYRRKLERRGVTYFVSGPDDFTEQEFDVIAQKLTAAVDEAGIDDTLFVLANSAKFGKRVQEYLIDVLGINPGNITLYKIRDCENYFFYNGVNINDDAESETEMDENMTYWSEHDITILRNWDTELTRESKNILRRYIYS